MFNSLYGAIYRTAKFGDVYPDANSFIVDYRKSGLNLEEFTDQSLTYLFYLLYAKYGNSNIASSDPNRFRYSVYEIIFSAGLQWQKAIEIQRKLMSLSDAQISEMGRSIRSYARDPGEGGTSVDNAGDVLINYINDQTVNKNTLAPVGAYRSYIRSLEDVTTGFLERFKSLFLKVVYPEEPLLYSMEDEENDN